MQQLAETMGLETGRPGAPSIWFKNMSTNIYISTFIDSKEKSVTWPEIPMHQWSTVVVSQSKLQTGLYAFKVEINGREQMITVGKTSQEYENVKVYNSDPFYEPALALTRNLEVNTTPDE